MPSASRGGRKSRNDLVFIAVLLAIAALAFLLGILLRPEGDRVVVTVDGEVYATYALTEEHALDIRTGANGEQVNRLVIREGAAFVEFATCPDGICAEHRPIFRDGESIICLPNRVVVTVTKQGDTDAPDIVA